MKPIVLVGFLLALVVSLPAVAGEVGDSADGQQLYESHGCPTCHGADGLHPISKFVPVLKGESADYIDQHASAIFGGVRESGMTHFMYDRFCVGEAQEEGCYSVPGSEVLRTIAVWLGGESGSPEKKAQQGRYVTSTQAHERLEGLGAKALLVDVRTRPEVTLFGMPSAADARIPYLTAGFFDEWDESLSNLPLRPNSQFVRRVEALISERDLGKDSPIYLISQSGRRDSKAADLLGLAGYREVYTVTDAFEGDTVTNGPPEGERMVNGSASLAGSTVPR